MKMIAICPDAHIGEKISKAYSVFKTFIKEQQPDEIVLLGDWMDVSALSGWDLDKKRKMENRRWKEEVAVANKELNFLQRNCGKITYLGGNHEDRVERYLDKNPEMEGMIEVETVLNLENRGIKFIKYTDGKLYNTGKLYYDHGRYTNKHFAKQTLDAFGCNIVVGHLHKPQQFFTTAKMQEPHICWALGTLGDLAPGYLRGRPSTSQHGFGVAYVKDNGNFSMYTINMSKKGAFMWNGKEYK